MSGMLIKKFFFFFKSAKNRPTRSEKQKINLIWPDVDGGERIYDVRKQHSHRTKFDTKLTFKNALCNTSPKNHKL